jgi:hypothetical protein
MVNLCEQMPGILRADRSDQEIDRSAMEATSAPAANSAVEMPELLILHSISVGGAAGTSIRLGSCIKMVMPRAFGS